MSQTSTENKPCFCCDRYYTSDEASPFPQLCSSCYEIPITIEDGEQYEYSTAREAKRVSFHLMRAERVALPATLTLEQWLATLEHFNCTCAYCQEKPYQVFEHFVPLIHGGGTTYNNCVPSCYKCNSRKTDLHPLQIIGKMREAITHVRNYLATCGSEDEE